MEARIEVFTKEVFSDALVRNNTITIKSQIKHGDG